MIKKVSLTAMAATLALSSVLTLSTVPAQAAVTFESLLEENGGDVPRNHWASRAIQQLVDKYGVMSGYPDRTFRGSRTLTRYELAAALFGVMKEIERRTGRTGPGPSADELRKLAALQRMLKDELDMLKRKVDALEKQADWMSKVQIHGGVEVRMRDRVSVTDGTQSTSPLNSANNSAGDATTGANRNNNLGDDVRDANGNPQTFNSPSASNLTESDSNPFRVRSTLKVKAGLTDAIRLQTQLDMFENGVSNGGHDANEGSPGGAQFTVRSAFIDLGGMDKDMWGANLKVGFMNFGSNLNANSSLVNHFNNSLWTGHGYGLVGWGGSEKQLTSGGNLTSNSVSRYWVGGLNASNVDPDSARYNQTAAPGAMLDLGWGWGKVFVGANYGSTLTNRKAAAEGNLSGLYAGSNTQSGVGQSVNGSNAGFNGGVFGGAILPSLDTKNSSLSSGLLALPSEYGDGYAVAGLDLMFFKDSLPVRLGVHGMNFLNDSFTNFSNSRKELSGVLDIGWSQNFGLTVGVNKSFSGYDKHSVGLFFNDLGGSGFDIQLGTNLATRGIFNVGDVATGSVGLALGVPFVNMGEGKDNIKLLLAARQSLGDGALFSKFKDAGLTSSLMYYNIASTPFNVSVQYSMLAADEIWSFKPVAHDVAVLTSYWF